MLPETLIAQAATLLRRGELVAFPTETVYGLGALADDDRAVARVFTVKGRPAAHPLIVHVDSLAAVERYAASIPDEARRLAHAFWPGPLTLVLPRRDGVAAAAAGGHATIAVRVPAHPVARALLAAVGAGIAAPSANRFGSVSPTRAEHVLADLGSDVAMVLDGGPCEVGVESTIVDCTGALPSILRPGGVTREELERCLGVAVALRGHELAGPSAPGTLPSHYAPRAIVRIVSPIEIETAIEAARRSGERAVLLAIGAPPVVAIPVIGLGAGIEDAARGLYAALREADDRGFDVVITTLPIDAGLGLAVADRLSKAAGPR